MTKAELEKKNKDELVKLVLDGQGNIEELQAAQEELEADKESLADEAKKAVEAASKMEEENTSLKKEVESHLETIESMQETLDEISSESKSSKNSAAVVTHKKQKYQVLIPKFRLPGDVRVYTAEDLKTNEALRAAVLKKEGQGILKPLKD